ncbi:MAG: 50S ribosomal protein L18 [Campylobacterales bacterium]|nr:50S ribosomal protein L18 [Campylobacterales bacterium]
MTNKQMKLKVSSRLRRKKRIRAKISGTVEMPRVSIFKSNRSLYLQAIDDVNGVTLASFDGAKEGVKSNKEGAKQAAVKFAEVLKAKKIENVVFDRNGYVYHGVVAAFADELRNQSIKL